MAIYAISDLHLSKAVDKPMDIFGGEWENYMDKIEHNWKRVVGEEDLVLIPGDLSWATYLEETVKDFRFLSALPGKKILAKGNHDYWWTTLNKMNNFLDEIEVKDVCFLHNNSFIFQSTAICGTRGWVCPGGQEFTEHDNKIYNRELSRLEISLNSLAGDQYEDIVVMLHYPPFYRDAERREFLDLMQRYRVKKCIYGHLHGAAFKDAVEGETGGIQFMLTSCDRINFTPIRLY